MCVEDVILRMVVCSSRLFRFNRVDCFSKFYFVFLFSIHLQLVKICAIRFILRGDSNVDVDEFHAWYQMGINILIMEIDIGCLRCSSAVHSRSN